ncbi:endonuclease III [Parvimonas sp. KA00067]|uniref:Endonuclease III n=2 Tax=Peptoniphilaceae TaxID=1570339 RepID=A0ABS1CAW4_9FIRM|nr:endonuclease III [Parvimonas sp. KA00067]MBK1469068.1 endonuclease III [Parvimonas parva]
MKSLSKDKINIVMKKLETLYPDAKPELNFSNSFELLIATILSAQCTDVRVNKVTEKLFKDFKTPKEFLTLDIDGLSKYIHSCGFYNSKSKNILETCKILVEKYNSEVPTNMEDLTTLPGVGRKTANVVRSCAFNIPSLAVDTHVFRVTNRIGIVNEDNVLDTELSLMKKLKKSTWNKAHHLFIFHGRRLCKSRKPDCENCMINSECLYFKNL